MGEFPELGPTQKQRELGLAKEAKKERTVVCLRWKEEEEFDSYFGKGSERTSR